MGERQVAELGPGTACCGWNHCGRRLAAGAVDGSVSVYDSHPSPSSKWQVSSASLLHLSRQTLLSPHMKMNAPFSDCSFRSGAGLANEQAIVNVVWLPPEYGDAIACACADGTLSLWEEVAADDQLPTWRKCKVFECGNCHILNVHFGLHLGNLKMVAAYSDGQVKVYELSDSLELDKWQLQAEFQNIKDPISRLGKPACTSASIAWNPRRGGRQQASFAIGFNSDSPHINSCKIWEFEDAHQRWLPLVELGSPEDKGDEVCAVAWAPNIGRLSPQASIIYLYAFMLQSCCIL
ncbi:hypothetical protein U9M48_018393 [Paspalum notatum var. saurae]|uniref:Sec13-like protein n=1 Tax=Paspalum notatum var. saurae TaxID=547442 RepID=A0AAQ3T9X5_PASNO